MIPKEELDQMYWGQEMSQLEIAKEIGVSSITISAWMKKYGIETRTNLESRFKGAQKPSGEKLYDMYWGKNMSQLEIASEICVSKQTVNDWMKECRIGLRTRSEARLNGDFTGEKCGRWKGGISSIPYCYKFNNKFKEAIRKRDDYTCQRCRYEQRPIGRKLSVHHIYYDKENCYPDVVALCRSCNSIVNGNRDYWEQYFENQLLERGLLNWSIN